MTARGGRMALVLWLLVLAACVSVIVSTRFVSDLSAFMPKAPNERQQVLMVQFRDGMLGRLIMIGIEGGDAVQRANLSRALAGRLRATKLFLSVQNGDAATLANDRAYFFGNRYLLSPNVTAGRFTVRGLHNAIAASIDALTGGGGMFLERLFPRDPTGETLSLIKQFDGTEQPRTAHGVWVSRDGKRAVLLAYTRAPGTDTDAQARAVATIRQTFARLASAGDRLLMSGTSVFSVKSRNAIEGQVARLAGASLLLVACLLLLVYRSPRLLGLGLLPVVSGALIGITAVSLSFGQVHGLTMGFGTTLIGEAVDYAIYFFLQRSGHMRQTNFWRTIWLGVATSIAGFAALLFSGFPGLAQLGVYTVSGLMAAAIVTRYVLPVLVPRDLKLPDLDRVGRTIESALQRANSLRWLPPLLAVVAIGVIGTHARGVWNRNLSALDPISKKDQHIDAELRRDLGAPALRYLVAFTAPGEQKALQGAEKVAAVLRTLEKRKIILGFNSPATVLPSNMLQRERQAAIPDAAQLRKNLRKALVGLPVHFDKLRGFVSDLEAARNRRPLSRADLGGTSAAVLYDSLMIKRRHGYLVLMPLRAPTSIAASPLDVARVQAALSATQLPHIVVIDVLNESTSVFENYRNNVLAVAENGILVIFVLLLVSLKSLGRALRVFVPLACAVACVAALIVATGTQLTILHLVGLLLVVAIGSNYALFFERGNWAADAAERRQMQVSLVVANLTTVGGFGILGLSSIPVLSDIGTTVSLGALVSLAFAAVLSRRPTMELTK